MTIAMPRAEVFTVLKKLGQIPNLRICLDAGDSLSYNTAVAPERWWNRATPANEDSFYRGATSGAEASDPTFNGTAGNRSSNEYFSFDGADYFKLSNTQPSWVDNMHKDNAKCSIACWFWQPNTSSNKCLLSSSSAANTGMLFITQGVDASGSVTLHTYNGVAIPITMQLPTPIQNSRWHFLAASLDEAGGAGASVVKANDAELAFNGVATSPSAAAAAELLTIGALQSGIGQQFPATTRLANMMVWEGRALNVAELRAIHHATRAKFGV